MTLNVSFFKDDFVRINWAFHEDIFYLSKNANINNLIVNKTKKVMFIDEGAQVVLRKENLYKFLKVSSNKKEYFGGKHFSLKNAIGHPFGSSFTVSGHEIELVKREPIEPFDPEGSCIDINIETTRYVENKDNRHLKDVCDNQKLTGMHIKELRDRGASGKEILEQIVEGSTTFEHKTKFSQEKYLNKKKKRHLNLFSIEKPNVRTLFDVYTTSRPDKCIGLHFDTVCRLLTFANVQAGSKVLLCETCHGLLTTAVIERLGNSDTGSIIQFHHGSSPKSEILSMISSVFSKRVRLVQLIDVIPYLLRKESESYTFGTVQQSTEDENIPNKVSKKDSEFSQEKPMSTENILDDHELSKTNCDTDGKNKKLLQRLNRIEKYLSDDGYSPDCLIIATRFHPVDLTLCLLQLLPIGKPFVVYSQFLQPMVDLYNALKQRGGVALIHLMDYWFRPIQILPMRTHPEMNMNSSSGYLLTGFTVEPGITTKQLLESGLITSAK